jgi:serine phosphatase RsbU (regulator of sigma subunit)
VRFSVPTDGVAVPMTAHGVTLGTLTVGRPADRPHGPEDGALIADVARRAALAVHNAQVTAAHVRVSQALQRALLPRALPVVPGLELAAEYLPASTGSDVGGDFYDVYAVGEGARGASNWLVAVGDVCGTGAAAAARTGLLRDVLRVLVREGRPLTRAIELLNDVMLESGGPLQFATLAAVLVTVHEPAPDGGSRGLDLQLVLAGHLQPVLVHADGRVEQVGRHGTAVGLVERLDLTCTSHTLIDGDALLLYTDGVVEIPGRDLELGIDRMLGQAERLVRDGFAGGAQRIVDSALAGETDDRALVLVWRE